MLGEIMGKVQCPHCGNCFETSAVADKGKTVTASEEAPRKEKKVYLEWQASYALGVAELDEQHARLVEIINELSWAVNSPTRDPNFVKKLIVDLTQFATKYFVSEEKMLKESAFPAIDKQILEHREFIKKIKELHEDFKKSVVSLRPLLTFLNSWFVKHCLEKDRDFASYYLRMNKKVS